MRISDWSSDVCSSDLPDAAVHGGIFGCVGAPPVFRAVRYFVGPFGGDGLRSRARRHRRLQWGAARAHDRRLFDPRRAVETAQRPAISGGRAPQDFPRPDAPGLAGKADRSEEHTVELQSLMRISSAAFCL